jgi:hypothetical protein
MTQYLSYWGEVYLKRAEAIEEAIQSSEQNVSEHLTYAEAEQRIDHADAVTALYMEVHHPADNRYNTGNRSGARNWGSEDSYNSYRERVSQVPPSERGSVVKEVETVMNDLWLPYERQVSLGNCTALTSAKMLTSSLDSPLGIFWTTPS